MSVDLDVRSGDITRCLPRVLVPEQRFPGCLGPGIDIDGGFVDRQELSRAIPHAVVLRREVQQRSSIDGQRDPGAWLLANADVIESGTVERRCTKHLNVATDDRPDRGGQVGGEALRFSDESVTARHSDSR
jgi:hypothetical protein